MLSSCAAGAILHSGDRTWRSGLATPIKRKRTQQAIRGESGYGKQRENFLPTLTIFYFLLCGVFFFFLSVTRVTVGGCFFFGFHVIKDCKLFLRRIARISPPLKKIPQLVPAQHPLPHTLSHPTTGAVAPFPKPQFFCSSVQDTPPPIKPPHSPFVLCSPPPPPFSSSLTRRTHA